jgi:hypothetical protein
MLVFGAGGSSGTPLAGCNGAGTLFCEVAPGGAGGLGGTAPAGGAEACGIGLMLGGGITGALGAGRVAGGAAGFGIIGLAGGICPAIMPGLGISPGAIACGGHWPPGAVESSGGVLGAS